MTKRIVVLAAGLNQPSSTRQLADRLAAATSRTHGLEIEVHELRDTDLRDQLQRPLQVVHRRA